MKKKKGKKMDTYFDNERIIAKSGGSAQAKYHDDCPMCNEDHPVCDEDQDKDKIAYCKACGKIISSNTPYFNLGYCPRCKEEIDSLQVKEVRISVEGIAKIKDCPEGIKVIIDNNPSDHYGKGMLMGMLLSSYLWIIVGLILIWLN